MRAFVASTPVKRLSIPGVVAVLTRDNLNVSSPYYGAYIKDQPIVALEKVRYVGDIVAAVAATDEKIAERAVHEIEVDYEELPGIFSVEDALSESAVIIHDENPARKDPKYGYGASLIRHDAEQHLLSFSLRTRRRRTSFQRKRSCL